LSAGCNKNCFGHVTTPISSFGMVGHGTKTVFRS
jgi:hypothetical protein